MDKNNLELIFIIFFIVGYSYGQQEKKFFRKDYTYVEETRSFYRYRATARPWLKAKEMCAMEGATLFYPQNEEESKLVRGLLKKPDRDIFLGISDYLVHGFWETIDGIPLDNTYSNWAAHEPNNAFGKEHCVIMYMDGRFDDRNCADAYAFVCKKTLDSLQWNYECNMPILGYQYSKETGHCYGFSLIPMSWTEAFAICASEQSYLAVINSQKEADYLVSLTASVPKEEIGGDYLRGAAHLGFHKKTGRWETIKGTKLENSGYSRWGVGEPNGGDTEVCGSMFYDGSLNDISCDTNMFFICEHEITPIE